MTLAWSDGGPADAERVTRSVDLEAAPAEVWDALTEIPYGETAGYGEVAITAGSPGAARAVGTACATTPFSIIVPVHRVVRSDGSLGEYGGHPEVKRYLLDLERETLGVLAPAALVS